MKMRRSASKLISYFSILVCLQVVSLPIALSVGNKTKFIKTIKRTMSTKDNEYFIYKDKITEIEAASNKQLQQLFANDDLSEETSTKLQTAATSYLHNLTKNSLQDLQNAEEPHNLGGEDQKQQFYKIYKKYQKIASDVKCLLQNVPLVKLTLGSEANLPQMMESKLDSTNTLSSNSGTRNYS